MCRVPPVWIPILVHSNHDRSHLWTRLKIKCDKQSPCQSCQVSASITISPRYLPRPRDHTIIETRMCLPLPKLESGNRTRNAVGSASLVRFETILNLFHISFVLAATEHLHDRITKMSARIRSLEDALEELQAKHSNDPHPLLRDDLVSPSAEDDEDPPADAGRSTQNLDMNDSLGTLSISDHGNSRFFGPTGGSEVRNLSNCISRMSSD